MGNFVQRAFNGGELSPALYARTDLAKYQTGLRTMRNWFAARHGGAVNRPGTVYVAPVKDATQTVAPRLIPFVFNDTQTYVLELGGGYVRFFQSGGQVVTSGVSAWLTATAYAVADLVIDGGLTYTCTVAHTSGATTEPGVGTGWQANWYALSAGIYEVPTPYQVADVDTIQFVQSNDVVTLVHPNYAPMALTRLGNTRWTLTPIVFGPAIGPPTGFAVLGGTAGPKQYYWAVTAVAETSDEESLATTVGATTHVPDATTPSTLTWNPVDGALSYNVYRGTDGTTFGLIGTAGGQKAPATDSSWTTTNATASTGTLSAWVVSGSQARNPVVALVTDKAYDGNYTIVGTLAVSVTGGTPTVTKGRVGLYYSRDGEARVFVRYTNETLLVGAGGTGVTLNEVLAVPDNGYAALTIDLVPEVYGVGGGGETVISTVTGTSIAWSKATVGFSDPALVPNYGIAPPSEPTLFAKAGDYPGAVGYYQQRLGFASTTNDPEKVWLSRVGSFHSFADSTPIQDDDPVSFRLAGRQVNSVRHLVDLAQLLVFTQGGIHKVDGDQSGLVTPSAINARQVAYNGVHALSPVLLSTTALYVQARGTIVRDLLADLAEGYKGNDLTIFATHLFDGYTLVDWAYAETPNAIVWAVRSDGTLLGLTYMREQAVWGWHRHDTDGSFARVCVVPEGNEDAVYVVVDRTVNSVAVRYIERFASRDILQITDAIFMDAALSYDGTNTTATTMTLSGGTLWDETETLPCTASASFFVVGDVGNAIVFTDPSDGLPIRCRITAYTSGTVVSVQPNRTVPVDRRTVATTSWSKAVDTLSGLGHLEGKAVSVIGDGFVVASPNNPAYSTVTVSSGSITLSDVYAVLHVGLPITADLETLDLDTASGPSIKEQKMQIGKVGLFVDQTRGLWAGRTFPTGTDATQDLFEPQVRDQEGMNDPVALVTDEVIVPITSGWDATGRVVVRQIDPLPATILAIRRTGFLPAVS